MAGFGSAETVDAAVASVEAMENVSVSALGRDGDADLVLSEGVLESEKWNLEWKMVFGMRMPMRTWIWCSEHGTRSQRD